MNTTLFAALEIGTTRIRALTGEARDDGHLMVTGVGDTASRGVRKGEIVDFDNASACVRAAIESAEDFSDSVINDVFLCVSGAHISSVVSRGTAPVRGAGNVITHDDVREVMEVARAFNLPADRAALHTICQHFYVDDQDGVINPESMEGSRLAVDMLILHAIRNRVRNMIRVVEEANVGVYDVIFSGLAAALAVLTAEQKESGVVLIDMGGGTTDYVAYADRAIACAGSFGVGGDHITNDIALGLKIPSAQALRLKEEWGNAGGNEEPGHSETIPLPAEGGFPGRYVLLEDLQKIIHARAEEMLRMVESEIRAADILPKIGSGVVLTGGGSHLKGVRELAERIFDLPCHVGVPRNVGGLALVTEGPEYATPVGALRYALKTSGREESGGLLTKVISVLRGGRQKRVP